MSPKRQMDLSTLLYSPREGPPFRVDDLHNSAIPNTSEKILARVGPFQGPVLTLSPSGAGTPRRSSLATGGAGELWLETQPQKRKRSCSAASLSLSLLCISLSFFLSLSLSLSPSFSLSLSIYLALLVFTAISVSLIKTIPCYCTPQLSVQGYLAHKKTPPPPRTIMGP